MTEVALIILFILILVQDVRHRGVHWLLFPLLFIVTLFNSWTKLDIIMIGINLGFLSFMLLSLTIYLSVKQGKWINITKGYFSLGDILFLIAVIPLFSFREYLIFFTLGTMSTLILHLLVSLLKKQKTVPYAGYMALFGIVLFGFKDLFNQLVNNF